jgi:hypothetical protein
MSSCVASSCTCCRQASSASATSASSPTDNVPPCCRSASACLRVHQSGQRAPLNNLRGQPSFRSVHTAAQPCTSSNGSPPLNCWFALHRSHAGKPHEPPTSTSKRLGASPSLPVLRHNGHSRTLFKDNRPVRSPDDSHPLPSTPTSRALKTPARPASSLPQAPQAYSTPIDQRPRTWRLPSSRCIRTAPQQNCAISNDLKRAVQIQH